MSKLRIQFIPDPRELERNIEKISNELESGWRLMAGMESLHDKIRATVKEKLRTGSTRDPSATKAPTGIHTTQIAKNIRSKVWRTVSKNLVGGTGKVYDRFVKKL